MATTYVVASLHAKLRALQCNQGGWGFQADQQAMEPTCLSILALRNNGSPDVESALRTVESLQNSDGSWPAFMGDEPEGCWTTALAVLSLMAGPGQNEAFGIGNPVAARCTRPRSKLVVAVETQHCRQQGAVRSSQVRLELGIRYDELGNPDCIRTHCPSTGQAAWL